MDNDSDSDEAENFHEFNKLIPDIQHHIIAYFVRSDRANFNTATLTCTNWNNKICSDVQYLKPAFYQASYWPSVVGTYITIRTGIMKSRQVRANYTHKNELEKELAYATLGEASQTLGRFPNLTALDLSTWNQVGASMGWNIFESGLNLIEKSIIDLTPRLTFLTLGGNKTIKDPHISSLTNLTELGLNGNTCITDKSLHTLTKLRKLDLDNNSTITEGGIISLTNLNSLKLRKNPNILSLVFLENLTELHLDKNPNITDKSLKFLTKMTHLDITVCPFISNLSMKHLTKLTTLKINTSTVICDESIRLLTNLTELELDQCPLISDDSIQFLFKLKTLRMKKTPLITDISMPHLIHLTEITLSPDSNITDMGMMFLTNLTSLPQLNNRFRDLSLKNMRNLTFLNLSHNTTITDSSLKHLRKLTSLDLSYNENITDKSLKVLRNLTSLNLEYNKKITKIGLKPLINLTSLNVLGSSITSSDLFWIMMGRKNVLRELKGFEDREQEVEYHIKDGQLTYELHGDHRILNTEDKYEFKSD